MNKILSIIVPVYNVERDIYACIDSIYQQGLQDETFETIIINDGTEDDSMIVIQDVVSKHNNIRIINQKNMGLSQARNRGLDIAEGEYILFVDSDDLLISNRLPSLVKHALTSKADLIIANYHMIDDNTVSSPQTDSNIDFIFNEMSGEQYFTKLFNPRECFVWRTLYKKEFLKTNQISFVPGIYYEDMPFTIECLLRAPNIVRTNLDLNLYRLRDESITSVYRKRNAIDYNTALARTWELLEIDSLSSDMRLKLQDCLFVSFNNALCYVVHCFNKQSERTEIINDLKKKIPKPFFRNGIKQILISSMYIVSPQFYIRLRYYYAKWVENCIIPKVRTVLRKKDNNDYITRLKSTT